MEKIKKVVDDFIGDIDFITLLDVDYHNNAAEYGTSELIPEDMKVVYKDDDYSIYFNQSREYLGIYGLTKKEFYELEDYFEMRRTYYFLEGMEERLKKAWKDSGLTQTQIAERVGCDRKTVNALLNGSMTTNIITFAKVCKVLDYRTDYILFGE